MKTILAALILHGYKIIYSGHDTLLTDMHQISSDGLAINILVVKSHLTVHRQANKWAELYPVKVDGTFYADIIALRAVDSLNLNP